MNKYYIIKEVHKYTFPSENVIMSTCLDVIFYFNEVNENVI